MSLLKEKKERPYPCRIIGIHRHSIRRVYASRSLTSTMAGLGYLLPLIYHEQQQPGSMLCAQHALNSLLRMSSFAYTLCSTDFVYIHLEGNYVSEHDFSL